MILSPAFNGLLAWLKKYLPYGIPAIVNLLLVFAGIFLSFQNWIGYIEKDEHSTLRRVVIFLCIALGLLGFGFDVVERYKNDNANHDLLSKVQVGLDETNRLLVEIGDVKTNVSFIPAIKEQMGKISIVQNQLAEAQEEHDTVREAELKRELSDAKLVVSQLRESARNWNAEEAHAKDEKERERIHGAWNHRDPLGNARPATLQLLALLPETSSSDRLKEIQLQDMKLHGQAFGGTGPEPLQGDADYLEALIQRVIAANPELAK